MKFLRSSWFIPVVLISFSFIVAFNVFLKRLDYDGQRKYASFGLSQASVYRLQELSGHDLATTLAIIKEQIGISTILVPEYTIASFERLSKITVLEGYQIINTLRVGQLYRTVLSRLRRKTRIDPNATYIVVDETAVYKRIVGHLKLYLPRDSVIEHTGRIIQVNISKDRLLTLPLGFDKKLLEMFISYEFNLVPQFKSFDTFSSEKLAYMFSELEKNPQVNAVMFDDMFNFSDQRHLDAIVKQIQRSNYKLIYPEFPNRYYEDTSSLKKIASQLRSEVVVSHGVHPDETILSFKQLSQRYLRAINERSPRLLIFTPLTELNIENLYDKNVLFMKQIIESFEKSGGASQQLFSSIPKIYLSFLERLSIAAGIFSALYMLILKVHRIQDRKQHIILIATLSMACFFSVVLRQYSSAILGAMAAIIGPVLAMVFFFPENVSQFNTSRFQRLFLLSKYIVKSLAVCLVAVVFCIALYSDPLYLNNIYPFWGVKLSLLLPVILIGFFYFCGPLRVNSVFYVIRRLMRFPITFYGLLIFFGVFFIMILYVFRSGNYFQIWQFESLVRNWLQDVFVVRPRFKEFMVGYPALLLGAWFAAYKNKDFLWLLNGLGVIGLSSFINSFCHFHTPVLISLYRSVIGLVLGIVFTVMMIYCWRLLQRIVKSLSLISK